MAWEANAVLEWLRNQVPAVPAIPLISALCMQGGVRIDPGLFAFHQDLVVRGVAHFLDGAGKFVFNDRLHVLLWKSETGLVGNPPELMAPYTQPVAVPEDCRSMFITFSKGMPPHRAAALPTSSTSETGLVGNPPELMAPYTQPVAVPEDCRSMFITFSKGMPPHREEIFEYFREKWGDCVVRVLMEKTKGGLMPMYGRIIFKTEAIVKLVLNGERLVKISIRHRQIWLRKYVPRPTNATA
uniref:RRM domain-containing protein n=1 Tax=Aegilops tauschii TaxID=37682 RepID=R7W7L0_AEGTA